METETDDIKIRVTNVCMTVKPLWLGVPGREMGSQAMGLYPFVPY